jgi:hypothetical protein
MESEHRATEKVCFVICPIDAPDSQIRKRSDQILKFIITPVADEHGYKKVVRADKIAEPGIITNDIIEFLDKADLVIADLTGHNPNVFYELAVRHMLRKPIIQIIAAGEKIPFDVASARTIPLDYRDMDSIEACKIELGDQMEALKADPSKVDNPISIAFDLQALTRSEDPEKQTLAIILEAIQNLGRRLEFIEEDNSTSLTNLARRLPRATGVPLDRRFDETTPDPEKWVAWALAQLSLRGNLPISTQHVAQEILLQGFANVSGTFLRRILDNFEEEGRISRTQRSDTGKGDPLITGVNPGIEELYLNKGMATG